MLCSGLIKGQSGHLTSNRADESNVKEDKTFFLTAVGGSSLQRKLDFTGW